MPHSQPTSLQQTVCKFNLDPPIPYIPLGVYHTGRFNAMIDFFFLKNPKKGGLKSIFFSGTLKKGGIKSKVFPSALKKGGLYRGAYPSPSHSEYTPPPTPHPRPGGREWAKTSRTSASAPSWRRLCHLRPVAPSAINRFVYYAMCTYSKTVYKHPFNKM